MNKSSVNGFVMLIVLVFIQLFALMGLYSLTQIMQHMKLNAEIWQKEEYLRQANYILHQIENQLLFTLPLCRISIIPATDMVRKPILWWETHGCSGNFMGIQYYYVLEFLGNESCVSVKKQENNNHGLTVDYYRLTLSCLLNVEKSKKIVLQSTIAKISDKLLSCQQRLHEVVLGQQMQREI